MPITKRTSEELAGKATHSKGRGGRLNQPGLQRKNPVWGGGRTEGRREKRDEWKDV